MIPLEGNLMSEKNHTTISNEALIKYFLVRSPLSCGLNLKPAIILAFESAIKQT